MSLETKDYITISLSTAAFVVSCINLLRSFREARVTNIRFWEQKRLEAVVETTSARAAIRQALAEVEAVRFEVRMQGAAKLGEIADGLRDHLTGNVADLNHQEMVIRNIVQPRGRGTEVIVMEQILGECKALAEKTREAAAGVSQTVATLRQGLAAGVGHPRSTGPG
jgi:hypothetical protein